MSSFARSHVHYLQPQLLFEPNSKILHPHLLTGTTNFIISSAQGLDSCLLVPFLA